MVGIKCLQLQCKALPRVLRTKIPQGRHTVRLVILSCHFPVLFWVDPGKNGLCLLYRQQTSLKFSNSLKRKYIHRRGPFLQNLFVNPIAVFEWFECGCRNLCGKISTCLGYFRVIILCLGFASPLHDITESSLRLYVKFGEVFERKISSAKKCGACNLFPLGLAVAVCLSFSFYTRGCLLLLFGACVVVFQTHCISNFNFSSARLILQNKKLALYCF